MYQKITNETLLTDTNKTNEQDKWTRHLLDSVRQESRLLIAFAVVLYRSVWFNLANLAKKITILIEFQFLQIAFGGSLAGNCLAGG